MRCRAMAIMRARTQRPRLLRGEVRHPLDGGSPLAALAQPQSFVILLNPGPPLTVGAGWCVTVIAAKPEEFCRQWAFPSPSGEKPALPRPPPHGEGVAERAADSKGACRGTNVAVSPAINGRSTAERPKGVTARAMEAERVCDDELPSAVCSRCIFSARKPLHKPPGLYL
jgi:hypothetical protein